jgi:hypothetical protein
MDNLYSNRTTAGQGLYVRQSVPRLVGELKASLDVSAYRLAGAVSHPLLSLSGRSTHALPARCGNAQACSPAAMDPQATWR